MRWLDSITNSVDLSLNKLRDNEGQESLVYCSPEGHKESDTTEQLNTTNNSKTLQSSLIFQCQYNFYLGDLLPLSIKFCSTLFFTFYSISTLSPGSSVRYLEYIN